MVGFYAHLEKLDFLVLVYIEHNTGHKLINRNILYTTFTATLFLISYNKSQKS